MATRNVEDIAVRLAVSVSATVKHVTAMAHAAEGVDDLRTNIAVDWSVNDHVTVSQGQ